MTDPTTDPTTELRDLIHQLTHEHDEPVVLLGQRLGLRPMTRVGGDLVDKPASKPQHRRERALLARLAEASVPTISSSGRGTALGSRIAFDPAASELHTAIHGRIRVWAAAAEVPRHWSEPGFGIDWTDPAQLLTAWHARTLHTDPATWIPTLAGWVTAIRDLVTDPPRRWTLDAPCPQCGQRWADGPVVEDAIPADEPYGPREAVYARVDALAVAMRDATDTWTTCRNCGALWTGLNGAEHLAELIEQWIAS